MKFYIQLNNKNQICDCIENKHEGYILSEIETPLPEGFCGGWYRWENNGYIYDRELFEQINEIPLLKEAVEQTKFESSEQLAQIIQDARNGLVSIPKAGEAWDVAKNYIDGDTATDGGVLYVARRYSRGKRPSECPDCWEIKVETTYPEWSSIADSTIIYEGDRVTQDGFTWECISQHLKSTVYKPKDGSSKWIKIN